VVTFDCAELVLLGRCTTVVIRQSGSSGARARGRCLGGQRSLAAVEWLVKRPLFGCHMCGQCVLHSTGLTCPMTCPKQLRNGPCGGVRADGHCEVKPEMRCRWVRAYERSRRFPWWREELNELWPPVDRSLEWTSSWVNFLTGRDRERPPGWLGD